MTDLVLRVNRRPSSVSCTLGQLLVGDYAFCDTLEDLVREVPGVPVAEWKIAGETAIPAGDYELVLTVSDRASRGHLWTPSTDFVLPQLVDVPGFEGVRIHAANTALNVEGCIAVGKAGAAGESIEDSRATLTNLMALLEAADEVGRPMRIQVRNP